MSDYLERHPPTETLPRLFAGSWIGHNFAIWVGHDEDNTAWDALHAAREYLLRRQKEMTRGKSQNQATTAPPDPIKFPFPKPTTPLERAWRELYIAEGSDWFWWYGDDHSSATGCVV